MSKHDVVAARLHGLPEARPQPARAAGEAGVNPAAAAPLVCICIPTFNAAATVLATLDSIVRQSYTHLRIVVVDNASSDDTVALVSALQDARIEVFRNESNLGGEGNFNRCIAHATGKYLAIFHADDLYEQDMVGRQVAFLEAQENASAVFTCASLIDAHGNQYGALMLPDELAARDHLYHFPELFKAVLHHSNFLICPSVMARRSVYQEQIQGWRGELFGSAADLDVWLRMARCGPVGILPEPLMRYRVSHLQFTAQVRLQTTRADFFRVTDFYLALGDVRATLSERDWRNAARLERRDQIMRAVNLYIGGKAPEARSLLKAVLCWDSVLAALQGKRGLLVMVLGGYLQLLLLFRGGSAGRSGLAKLKHRLRK